LVQLLEFVFDFNDVTKPQGETTYVRAIGQPSFPDPSQARRLLHHLYHVRVCRVSRVVRRVVRPALTTWLCLTLR
jgi:hypothetical protein